ncbi:MAG: hypothetical protein UT90_C0015G0004 [Parcubacteria group bacterium GW2011_GWA1_40_21]|nr:MAG: hypothetical protein UT90_C0015G0004 [Parcubacteria group bacterium GW2011_GWA1_40_21]
MMGLKNDNMKLKILLIHGWNYANYTSSGCVDAWANRSSFVVALSKHFEVVTFNLPGFCGEKDPETSWNIDDFAKLIQKKVRQENPDYILGYSFGGAVALRFKKITGDIHIKVILVSPAIIRKYEKKVYSHGIFQRILKTILPEKSISILRDIYLIKIVKNPYYAGASRVMRETYRNIVSVDLRNDLLFVTNSLSLIYGEKDTATPNELVRNVLKNSTAHHNLYVISGGGHDIANTHTEELVSVILKIKEGDGYENKSENLGANFA